MRNKDLTTKNSGPSSSYFLSVEITANGVDYTDIGLFLTVLPPIILSYISPIFISSHLHTPLSVTGGNFNKLLNLSCVFIDESSQISVIRTANIITENVLYCITPKRKRFQNVRNENENENENRMKNHTSSITSVYNDDDKFRIKLFIGYGVFSLQTTHTQFFQYYNSPKISTIFPTFAFVKSRREKGEEASEQKEECSAITILGQGMFSYLNQSCLWTLNLPDYDDNQNNQIYQTELRVISPELAYCNSPNVLPGEYSLALTFNGMINENEVILEKFQISELPVLISLSSTYGMISVQSEIIITGRRFLKMKNKLLERTYGPNDI